VLPVGPEGGDAAGPERLGALELRVLRDVVGPVVVDLVVVEGDDPREGAVAGLEVGVRPVAGVAGR